MEHHEAPLLPLELLPPMELLKQQGLQLQPLTQLTIVGIPLLVKIFQTPKLTLRATQLLRVPHQVKL